MTTRTKVSRRGKKGRLTCTAAAALETTKSALVTTATGVARTAIWRGFVDT